MVKLYLQHCSRTVQPKYSSVCSAFYGGLFPEPGRVAYNACTKAVAIKWGNSNFARTVWRFWLAACKYVFIFKEFATDYSNASFELCRVGLVVCHFSNHKCRHGNVYMARCNATRKKTVQVIIISKYVPTGCNKCLVYNGFYCFCVVAPGQGITIR